MTNTKIMDDKHTIDMMTKSSKIEELKDIKTKLEQDILSLVRNRDDYRNELKLVANAKEKLEGRLFVDRNNNRDI